METGFDFFKFIFSAETWTAIFTIGAAIWTGWKAYRGKEAEKGKKSKSEEITNLKMLLDETQQERDNDKKRIAHLEDKLAEYENNTHYISQRPSRKVTKSLRPTKRILPPGEEE